MGIRVAIGLASATVVIALISWGYWFVQNGAGGLLFPGGMTASA